MSHLLLLDGHHLMYRAFYAVPQTMKTATGELTNMSYGVASMLLQMLRIEQPTHVLFCFDAGEETFRHKEHAAYKEGRAETPDTFYLQIPRVMEFLDAFHVRHVSNTAVEADDLLCAYAREGERQGGKVTIVTGDRDAFQLATEKVRIAIPHKGYSAPEYLGPREIYAKYGIRPDQVPSYKGLCGDASDNLPGVMGIGPKGAAKLLQQFDSLSGVYAHLDDIPPAVRLKLEKDKEQAFFSERMATLVSNFPLPLPLDDLVQEARSMESVEFYFRSMEFMSLLKRLQSLVSTPYGSTYLSSGAPQILTHKTQLQLPLF